MRILLLNDRRTERESMIRALPAEIYHVEAAADEPSALVAIAREAPQVIVFCASAKGAPDLARRLKGADASAQAYVLAVLDAAPSAAEIANLMAAGVHDFIRRPILGAELLERVNAPARLIRWARLVVKPAAFDSSASIDVTRLQAWKNLGRLVAADLGQLACQTLAVSEGWPKHFGPVVASATIPMSLVVDEIEVRVSIVVDSGALRWIRESVLGDANANEVETSDALRELANMAGGAIKRAALGECVILTTGIPVNDRAASFPGEHRCWTLSFEKGSGCVALAAEIRKLGNQRVSAAKLVEGMILAHDLRSADGVLLAPAGSRLTSTMAARLAHLLGTRCFLEVAQPHERLP